MWRAVQDVVADDEVSNDEETSAMQKELDEMRANTEELMGSMKQELDELKGVGISDEENPAPAQAPITPPPHPSPSIPTQPLCFFPPSKSKSEILLLLLLLPTILWFTVPNVIAGYLVKISRKTSGEGKM